MRRTLTVVLATAALLAPAGAAFAEKPDSGRVQLNASCSNGKGGNNNWDATTYSGGGNTDRAAGCVPKVKPPVDKPPVDTPPVDTPPVDTPPVDVEQVVEN